MSSNLYLSLFTFFVSASLQAAPLFESSVHCIKDGGFYLGCTRQTQVLPEIAPVSSPLKILENLPQKLRIGYRFYCSNVTGFGDLDAKLRIGLDVIGISRSKEPQQQELTLLLQPGTTPILEAGTTKKATRLAEDCRFELTSANVLPLTSSVNEIFNLMQTKKQIAEYLNKNAENSEAAINRSLGYMQGRKIDWQSKIVRSEKAISVYQKKLDGLDIKDEARSGYEVKLAEQSKAKSLYEEELTKLNLVLTDFAPLSVKVYADDLLRDYQAEAASLMAYLDRFQDQVTDDVDMEIVLCTLNPTHSSCGE